MIDISCKNYFLAAGQSGYQAVNRSRKRNPNDMFKTQIIGNTVYIEQTSVGRGISWSDVRKIPGKYALKDGNSITMYYTMGECGYEFFHAAESTEENPVLVAKGVDMYGTYFEEKIDVKQINPYNTSTLELQALSHFKPDKAMMNPYDCMEGQEKDLRERINYVAGAQNLIAAWKRIGHSGQAAQWRDELNFLLDYTENTAEAGVAGNEYKVNEALFEGISEGYKRNMELYCNAARERLAASIAKRCSEDLLNLL